MANKTITQLPANAALAGTEEIPIWQSGASVKLTITDLGTYLGVGGAATWGSITGTLSSQTDLQTALDAKQPDIQFKNEGVNIGTSGGVSAINFVGDGVTAAEAAGTVTVTIAASGSGGGTVTSVGLSMPSFFNVTNSPITTSGTIGVTVTDPAADSIVFWDDSASALAYASLGTGLSFSTTTLGLDATLAALAGVTTAADSLIYATAADTFTTTTLTAGGRALINSAGTANTFPYFSASNTVTLGSVTAAGLALLDDADASAQRTTLGLGSWATKTQTVSTAAASGTPADGDIWIMYTP